MQFQLSIQCLSYLLLFFYFVLLSFAFYTLQDTGVHIEEKFHRLNGHYWLNYVSEVLGFSNLHDISSKKISEISDFSLSSISLYNKYGVIFDLPAAFLEIFLGINEIKSVYYLKHFLSFSIFLLSSFAFYKILFALLTSASGGEKTLLASSICEGCIAHLPSIPIAAPLFAAAM